MMFKRIDVFMENIKFDERRVKIVVNPVFYPEEKIKIACKDYSKICQSKIKKNGKKLEISLIPKSKELDTKTLVFEFMNYVLGLSKKGVF